MMVCPSHLEMVKWEHDARLQDHSGWQKGHQSEKSSDRNRYSCPEPHAGNGEKCPSGELKLEWKATTTLVRREVLDLSSTLSPSKTRKKYLQDKATSSYTSHVEQRPKKKPKKLTWMSVRPMSLIGLKGGFWNTDRIRLKSYRVKRETKRWKEQETPSTNILIKKREVKSLWNKTLREETWPLLMLRDPSVGRSFIS